MKRNRAPYVSHVKLYENSHSAMLSAIELFNKPRIDYRNEISVILIVNAWELAIKGALRQQKVNVHKKRRRGQSGPYESKTLDQCLDIMRNRKLWPKGLDGAAVSANIVALSEYRNRAIHLYNAAGLGTVVYAYMQQSVINYRDFLIAQSGRDLADSITWDLLPLGSTTPHEAVQFMRAGVETRAAPEVLEFIDELREALGGIEESGGDTGRVYTYYDVSLQNKKNAASSDLIVAVDNSSGAKVVKQDIDPNTRHPLRAKDVLDLVNKKRKGRELNTYDRDAVVWKEDLKNNPRYSFHHKVSPSRGWSYQTVTFMCSKDDTYYDSVRSEYSAYLADRRNAKSSS